MNKVDLLPFKYLQTRHTSFWYDWVIIFQNNGRKHTSITGSDASHITARWTLAHVRLSELSSSTHYRGARWVKRIMYLKPHANGLIVGQQLLTLLDVAHPVAWCCVFGSCCANFETDQTFSYVQTDATTPNNVASVCTGLYGQQLFSVSSYVLK